LTRIAYTTLLCLIGRVKLWILVGQNRIALVAWVVPDRVKSLHLLEEAEACEVRLRRGLHQITLVQLVFLNEVRHKFFKRSREIRLLCLVLFHLRQSLVDL